MDQRGGPGGLHGRDGPGSATMEDVEEQRRADATGTTEDEEPDADVRPAPADPQDPPADPSEPLNPA